MAAVSCTGHLQASNLRLATRARLRYDKTASHFRRGKEVRAMRRSASNALAAACVTLGLMQVAGCGERLAAPKAFVTYHDKEGAFSCLYPEGWEKEGGGRSDYSWAKFSKGSAQIKISADFAGSVLADIAKSTSGPFGSGDDSEPPVAKIHEMMKKNMADEFSNYREKAAKPITTALGEGRQSEFTASGSFNMRLRGTRTTLLSNDRRITVICSCPATDWRTLKSAFDKVVKSVTAGR
jgi:hypothetical protein